MFCEAATGCIMSRHNSLQTSCSGNTARNHEKQVTFVSRACGALSVPRKNFLLPLVAASSTARRCFSLFKMGKQKE